MSEVAKATQGIKEVKEVTEALMEFTIRIASVLKDGFQTSDLTLIFELFSKDEILRKKLSDAYEGFSKVGGELKDLDLKEGVELSIVLLQFIPKIIELFKKEAIHGKA